MRFRIVTPERVLLEREVDSVTVPTQTGEITILKNHIPLVSNLRPGELKFTSKDGENFFAVSGGFVEVRGNNEVVVLADTAETGEEIDMDRAEQAKEMAKKVMAENYSDQTSTANAIGELEKHLARLKVARKHRSRKGPNIGTGGA
jgi:F-type H+-transporting ATPase subunit epsilon